MFKTKEIFYPLIALIVIVSNLVHYIVINIWYLQYYFSLNLV